MKIFITGASGLVGSAVVPRLLRDGHTITALARSQASADKLTATGVSPVLGSLADHAILASAASDADAIIHLAFDHGMVAQNRWADAGEEDAAAITAIGNAIKGTGKTFIAASGTLGLAGPDELAGRAPGHEVRKSESALFAFTSQGVRTIGLRLAPLVHVAGHEHLFVQGMIKYAKAHGFVPYVGEGNNVWAAVNVDDVADLVAASLGPDTVPAGSNLHAIAEEGIRVKDIAEFVGKKLGLETRSITKESAATLGGFLGIVLALGERVTNTLTRQWTGWDPKGPTLFDDVATYSSLSS